MNIIIKTPQQIDLFRQSGAILREVQEILKKHIKEGVSLIELDEMAENHIIKSNALPATNITRNRFLGNAWFESLP